MRENRRELRMIAMAIALVGGGVSGVAGALYPRGGELFMGLGGAIVGVAALALLLDLFGTCIEAIYETKRSRKRGGDFPLQRD